MRILEERKDYTLYYHMYACKINKAVILIVVLDCEKNEYYEYHQMKEYDKLENILRKMGNKLIKRYKRGE